MSQHNLNIYSPEVPEGDSYILGNRKGLIKLKHLIEDALDEKHPHPTPMVTARGEDFRVVVSVLPLDISSKLKEPFTAEIYNDSDGLSPIGLLEEHFEMLLS